MANKSLFSTRTRPPRANSINEAGGVAYELSPKQALAQLAATGCFHGVFYAQADEQLDQVLKLIDLVDDNHYLARLAIYARERACMKDMPAALLCALSKRDMALTHRVFDRVVDNGRVLRTLFQMVRSGRFGRRGLSTSLQRAFQRWLNAASDGKLLSASIGADPSLRDILRMARPTPPHNARRALYGWLTGKDPARWAPATPADLPELVQTLQAYRASQDEALQALLVRDLPVRWDLLADAARGPLVWKAIARQMGPQALRMNLNTLLRHEVFQHGANGPDRALIDDVAARIGDADEIRRSKQFPYQYLAAYLNAHAEVPQAIKAALHQAAEIACGNVPALPGPVVIGLDVSGSMSSPITGSRGNGATSKMRCVDVAALFAAALLRRNPDSLVVPFDTSAYAVRIDPQDQILSLAQRLSQYGGGGTDCSLPIAHANHFHKDRRFAGVVLVSDSESWVYKQRALAHGATGATGVMEQWETFVKNQVRLANRESDLPKLVCINLQPYMTTQAPERSDILNIGGFSDAVFQVIAAFLAGDEGRFVREVEAVTL